MTSQPSKSDQSPSANLRSATAWSYGLTLGKVAITTGLSLVLAAMLGPRAFGVIAMALVFTNFIEMLQQQGLMPAIISRRELRDEHTDTAFWLILAVSVTCTVAGIAAAQWWADVNELPELASVIRVLALGIPFMATAVVHEALLRRNLQFKTVAIRTWVSVIAGGAIGIAGALGGWGVWALVAQQLTMNITTAIMLWIVSPWRPHFRIDKEAAAELWSYSIRTTSSSLGLFLGRRLDVILAGPLFGPIVVGLYRMGHRLSNTVADFSAKSMQQVALPALSRVQNDSRAFVQRLLDMQRFTSSLAFPALGILAGVAPAVEYVLGEEWSDAAIAIRLLAISQAIGITGVLLGPALQARGRPGSLAAVLWIWSGLTAAAIALVATRGRSDQAAQVEDLCLAILIANIITTVILTATASRAFRIPALSLPFAAAPGALAGMVAGIETAIVTDLPNLNPWLRLVAAGLLGLTSAAAVLGILDPVIGAYLRHPSAIWRAIRSGETMPVRYLPRPGRHRAQDPAYFRRRYVMTIDDRIDQ